MNPRNKRLSKIPKLYIPKDCKNFYIRITTFEGKRKSINLGTSERKAARIRARKEVDLLNGQIEGTVAATVELEQMVKEYYLSKVNMAPLSLIRHKQHMEFFLTYMKQYHKDIRYMNHIGAHHISEFQNVRMKDDNGRGQLVSSKTVRESVYVVKNLFKWAIRRDYMDRNPVDKIDIVRAFKKDQHVFTDEELIKILKYCNGLRYGFIYPAFLTLITTGMRSGELTHLTWDDIDFERNVLKIRTKILPDGQPWRAKTKQNRELKMDEEVRNILMQLKLKSKNAWVFINTEGRRQNKEMLWIHLRNICDQLEIPRGQVHSLRRNFACMMDKSVNDRVAIQQTLGHTTTTMTDRYCGYRPKEYVDKAHLKTTAEFIKKLKEDE